MEIPKELWVFVWLAAGHFVGDFGLQSAWMSENKGKSWFVNFFHACVYTASILGFSAGASLYLPSFSLPLWAVAVIFVTHFAIDPLQARLKKTKLWQDQLMHYIVLLAVGLVIIF